MLSFLALPASLASVLIAAVAAVICLLFLIKPARIRIAVASTLIWQRALGEKRAHHRRRRWIVSLIAALLIGSSLALAVTRPQLGGSRQRVVVVLDNTVSMSARTAHGSSRWNRAVAAARALVSRLGSNGEVLLLDTAGTEAAAGFVSRDEALVQLTRLRPSSRMGGRVPPLPVGEAFGGAHLFTDGVGIDAVPTGVTVYSVFEAAANVGITGFEARPLPGDPTRYQAFIQIANTGPMPKPVALDVRGAGGFHVSRELEVAAETVINLGLDVTSVAKGPLQARILTPGDAFPLDDSAYCVVLPHREKRILLVTSGNPPLEDSLRALPGVSLAVKRPASNLPMPAFDTYIFDRYAPADPPAAGALLFRPPPTPWLDASWQATGKVTKLAWDDAHPLSAGVSWRSVRLDAARSTAAPEGRAVVTADTGRGNRQAVVVAGEAKARWAAAGFALNDSNLPLQTGFPVFLVNAVNWLASGPELTSASVGLVELPLREAEVFEVAGNRVAATRTPDRTLFEATGPGVYLVRSGEKEDRIVVVNANDLRVAQINHRRIDGVGVEDGEATREAVSWPEPGILLLVLALVLLTIEWASFSRGATE
ncbi:MAG: BatA domain-containing protein [Betaproteobacteria bacterium]|nr:BatA domain-containing protein [Betaproteobacteria bacterium]